MKKKLSNIKPTKKPQGPCPSKRRKVEKTTDACKTKSPEIAESLQFEEQNTNSKTQDEDEGWLCQILHCSCHWHLIDV